MPPTAVLRENADSLRPSLIRTAGVFAGTRHYDIFDAVDLDDCYNATSLPASGQIWSPARPKLKARGFDPVYQPGPVPFYILKIQYREDTLTEYTADPELVITTTLSQSSGSDTVDYDITGTKTLTNDGRGVPKMLSSVSFEVLTFSEALPNLDLLQAASNEPKVNSNQVLLKNFMNSGESLLVDGGQLLYANYTPGFEQGLFTIRHHLEWRESWKNRKPLLDGNGKQRTTLGVGLFEEADVYEEMDLGPLLG